LFTDDYIQTLSDVVLQELIHILTTSKYHYFVTQQEQEEYNNLTIHSSSNNIASVTTVAYSMIGLREFGESSSSSSSSCQQVTGKCVCFL
jgi:hypothetical protein